MLEKIYNNSPIWFQEIMITGYGLKTYLQRYTGNYKKYKKNYLNKDYSCYEKELENQIIELKKLLKYARSNSKYYFQILKNVDIESINKIEDIKNIPILEKETLREKIDEIIIWKDIKNETGGTTGKPLVTYFKKDDFLKRMAYLNVFKEKHGVRLNMKSARFSGKNLIPHGFEKNNKYWRTNRIINQRLYSTFHMNNKTLKYYVENLNIYKPQIIDGFISCIYEVAKYIKENKMVLKFKPIVIFVTSETVLKPQKELVEEVFGCKVRNQYASSEGAPFITECVCGKLHYNMDTGIIEELENGEILVTSFTSYGTPLIRYKIGDNIKFDSKNTCDCGNSHPIIKKIEGRKSDFLFSIERGKINSVNMANAIKWIPNAVKNIQFIQEKVDEITINIAVDKKRYESKYDMEIIKEMENRFGKNMKFVINKMDDLPREKSGKFRYIKNNLDLEG
ncbi:hypothetical protein [uncultured Cetobacterium sp.]|uniref:phenylacetate--CoA ligase family protein n=1 Tax=uncultured Cetobacterium sp. TaxID=527638 RepID=UPI0026350638|nr:hypothetical protein [uncultured Cetobacterium sp.]